MKVVLEICYIIGFLTYFTQFVDIDIFEISVFFIYERSKKCKNMLEKILRFYKDYGILKTISHAFVKFWKEFINNREVMFYVDLNDMKKRNLNFPKNLIVEFYANIEDIPQKYMEQLIELKSKEILLTFLKRFFQRNASLWLGILDNNLVGIKWTIIGGFDGFWSLPITSNDVIVFSTEVLSDFRGQGINPAMLKLIFSKLQRRWSKTSIL